MVTALLTIILVMSGVAIEGSWNDEGNRVSAKVDTQPFLSFRWIEQGYNGVMEPVHTKLGLTIKELEEQFGTPQESGYHEGGEYRKYGKVTYIVDPANKQTTAVAVDIREQQLTEADLLNELGTPDSSELNELDGLWNYSYDLERYELFF